MRCYVEGGGVRELSFSPFVKWLGVTLAVLGTIAFLLWTPGNLLRTADYVGAAVCHRRASHSFIVDEHQLPLCQRCTGTFPGALTGVLVQWGLWRRRRSMSFPRWLLLAPVILFAAMWGLDGVNSATSESHIYDLVQQWFSRPAGVGILGYAPQPWLRLLTGALMGMSMSIVLVPAFNQTLWADGDDTRALRNWHEMALLIAVELGMAALIYLLEPLPSNLGIYVVSLYSALGVMAMFVLLGAMMFCLFMQRDGSATRWRDAAVPLIWGVVFALSVVTFMDVTRLWLTGTIDGVPGMQ
jgi:uncharacterized membrane protein